MTLNQANAIDAYAQAKSVLELATRAFEEAKKNLIANLGEVEKPVQPESPPAAPPEGAEQLEE